MVKEKWLQKKLRIFSYSEVKCTISAVALNRRNCQSLEGKEFQGWWREHQQDYEMPWAGQGKAGGCRESEPNSPNWAKREQGISWFSWKFHHIKAVWQELFQCTSLSECSALHYEEFEFINWLIKPVFVLSQLSSQSSAITQGVLPYPGAQQSVFERKIINKLIH